MKTYAGRIGILVALIIAIGAPAQQQVSHQHSAGVVQDNDWSELAASMEKMHVAHGIHRALWRQQC